MDNFLLEYEPFIRVGAFAGGFTLLAVLERLLPRRSREVSRKRRWLNNVGITFLNTFVIRIFFAAGAVGFAMYADMKDLGLFNFYDVPWIVAVVASVVILDFFIWLQHLVFHHVPALWRLHMMHHTDLDIDLTTGTRFHPLEMLISMVIKLGVIFFIGAPMAGVLIFEVLLNATSMFNHSNLKLPGWLDRAVRLLIVTPDMHRVHHSVILKETHSNFGFNLTWWDRVLGTYISQPKMGHENMKLGLASFREVEKLDFHRLMVLPFVARRTQLGLPKKSYPEE